VNEGRAARAVLPSTWGDIRGAGPFVVAKQGVLTPPPPGLVDTLD
jgi:hypothetical protein